ncbi:MULTISPECIES: spore coat U domain-containing protein [unclassified Lysobacter]|uniref:Csu type fimbrial protein n=1 Tax=unclassified Lysobacter TaxID=2635362 RepID=UPI001BEA2505|nr:MULTISPECIES: spore coat U domain-containing protein [unclassified Lysobacter]MBT2748431.1 spore coat protein U domain-containing protein [Lysobacter sp. ISL-42]MBT2749802.1 spore coat protein U domain-containing protein [Lysobacter sp. ISL-50]MBT2781130.1 spore coat protein U domain-containing protein [Lysobacter sp. ISL-52]
MRPTPSRLFVAVLALAAAGPAFAAVDTANLNVTITITSICDIHTVATLPVNFGSVSSIATNVDQQGQLTINCTPGTAYTIALDNGQNGTDVNTRKMASGANLVPYQLYRASARGAADVWGSTTGVGGNVLAGSGTGAAVDVPVYGRTPSANFPAGTYNDLVVATVTY